MKIKIKNKESEEWKEIYVSYGSALKMYVAAYFGVLGIIVGAVIGGSLLAGIWGAVFG